MQGKTQNFVTTPKNKKTAIKRPSATKSTRRPRHKSEISKDPSHKSSSVPSKQKVKLATPKAVPKLLFSNLYSPRSPRKLNPSTTRSRHKSGNHNSGPSSLLNTAVIVRNTSDKVIEQQIPTTQLLQTKKKSTTANEEALKVWQALKIPATAGTVISLLQNTLSTYEKSEILSYYEVFYTGIYAKKPKSKTNSKFNYGFDDERGDYNITLRDHIAYRYEIIKLLGSGSFGQVVLVKDHKLNQDCALKIIRNKTRFHQQALVEVEILKLLNEKDANDNNNVVHVIDHLMFRKHMVSCYLVHSFWITQYKPLRIIEK